MKGGKIQVAINSLDGCGEQGGGAHKYRELEDHPQVSWCSWQEFWMGDCGCCRCWNCWEFGGTVDRLSHDQWGLGHWHHLPVSSTHSTWVVVHSCKSSSWTLTPPQLAPFHWTPYGHTPPVLIPDEYKHTCLGHPASSKSHSAQQWHMVCWTHTGQKDLASHHTTLHNRYCIPIQSLVGSSTTQALGWDLHCSCNGWGRVGW